MTAETQSRAILDCPACGTHIAPKLLACPACGQFVHAGELKRLAESARVATQAGDLLGAIVSWRDALDLLPPQAQQHATIVTEVDRLSRLLDQAPKSSRASLPAKSDPAKTESKSVRAKLSVAAGFALTFLIKFKALLFILLTKGKLLLLGLTKASTFFSMLASVGAYWTMWGWQFATGFVVSLYVHEMGHVAALRRYGISAGAPMFLPGIGAFVRLKQAPINPVEDARIGLAGPWWGAAAAVLCYAISLALHSPLFAAIAHSGALLNLFNLVPIWQLDGARAFRAMSRTQRVIVAVALAAILFASGQHLLMLVAIVAVFPCIETSAPAQGDIRATVHFLALVVGLTPLSLLNAGQLPLH